MNTKTINYQLISASGNPTAIISGNYAQKFRKIINQSIFQSNKLVEQIGYIYQINNKYYFDMMGQEFSGNGCRSAAFCFLRQQPGIIQFQSSGAKSPIAVALDKNNNSTVTIPNSYQIISTNPFCLKMLNNYQIVIEGKGNLFSAKNIIASLPTDTSGIGIMYINKVNDINYQLNPFFYTRGTDTLVNETACGSGTTAATIYLSQKFKQDYLNLNFTQPSKLPIYSRCYYSPNQINTINISGPTKLLGNYNVKIKL